MHVEIDRDRPGPDYLRVSSTDAYGMDQILARITVAALTKLRDDVRLGRGGVPDELETSYCWSQYTFAFMHDPVEQHQRARAIWIGMIERMIDGFEFILGRGALLYDRSQQEFECARREAEEGRTLYAKYFWSLYV